MSSGASYRPPDLVLRRGVIRPFVDERPPASAMAVGGGTILAVGDDSSILDLAGPRTRIVDLGGRAVLPSFTDSHTHFHRAAVLRRWFLDFETLAPTSVAAVVDLVARRAATLPPGAWIQGDSLSVATLEDGRLPNRRDLDAVAPDHPVVLRGIGKHVVCANSDALRAAGIDRTTADPPGGRIERDEDGEPTGILHERAKLRLDSSDPETVVPSVGPAERQEALVAGFADLHALGITTIHEMIRLPQEAIDFGAVHADGRLGVRTRLSYRIHETPIRLEQLTTIGIRRGFGDEWLRVLGVKISVDGWCIFRNAAVHEPYRDDPTNTGLMRIEPDELVRLTCEANAAGLGVALHAVGPRAVDAALTAFAAAGPATAGPYRLEHGHLDMDAARLRRMAELGIVWSVQPALRLAYGRDWAQALEPERVARILPLADGLAAGLTMIHNSDVPSGPQSPLDAIRAAVEGVGLAEGEGRQQVVPTGEAWRAWTTVPAAVAGERTTGTLGAGRSADAVVLSHDPLATMIRGEARASVVATMIGGRFVYGADEVGE